MSTEHPIKPEGLIVAKPAQFNGCYGYAIFLNCSFFLIADRKDFVCGVVPSPGQTIEEAAAHVHRALAWLTTNPEDPRVGEISPPVDKLWFRKRRVWQAICAARGETSRVIVGKMVNVWRDADDVETLDEPWMRPDRTEKEDLDRREAYGSPPKPRVKVRIRSRRQPPTTTNNSRQPPTTKAQIVRTKPKTA